MSTAPSATPALDTFPRLLVHHARTRGNHPATREKDLGIWQTWTWSQVAAEVRALACGLAAQGFRRGMHLAIIGDNRPRLYWTMTAVQALGGIPVPMYQDAPAAEFIYVLNDCEIAYAIVEDQEQVDKVLEAKREVPALAHIYYDDPRGLRHYDGVTSFERLQEIGREYDRAHPGFFEAEIAKGAAEDVSVMLYTSGTTGKPKGVCQTHRSFIAAAGGGCAFDRLTADDRILSYLPMAWVGDHLFSYAQAMYAGFTINCPESGETVMTDLREIGPTYFFAPPRVFENLLTQVMIRMEDASAPKRWLFRAFMAVAKRAGAEILDGKPGVSALDRALYAIGGFVVYAPLRNVLGMSRIRVAYTAGAAIGPDLFRFYRSIGINLKQLYGSTETCAYVCLQPDGSVRFDTVGIAAPGVELHISGNGEVMVRGPMLMKEYYRRPDATAETIDARGYLHTGDAGVIDGDGHLRIIDRAKDVGKLAGGAMFAPNYIENKLKFFPHIKEAVAFGDQRDNVCAFINIDMGSVGNWAERRGIAYSGYTDLAQKPEVYVLIKECVESVNVDLAADPALSASQVHRFLILHKELDPDDDELTRTRKVRRGFVAEKYAVLIDALYAGRSVQHIETLVKFEDGRSGMVAADLKIEEAATTAGAALAPGSVTGMPEPMAAQHRAIGDTILALENISLQFGGVKALADISFDVRQHEIRAIIGPNGAGKSSMLNVINGVYRPQHGTIKFRGRVRRDMNTYDAAAHGIARTFQNIALFKSMSVLDNIMTGRNLKMKASFMEQALWIGRARREEYAQREKVEAIIDFLEIQHIRKTAVGRLPYGLQKRVELARALAAEPELLLLDEPMAGMNVEEKQDMCRFILDVNEQYGTTIVLIEHDMGVVMDISDRVVVLDYGKKIGDGTPDEVRADKTVIDAYLGVAH